MAIIIAIQFYLIKFTVNLKELIKTTEKPQKKELTKEQKDKQQKLRKHFENLMGYGYEDALKKKE